VNSAGGSPIAYVRVLSEQYPDGIVPPMSTTTASPSRSARSETSWCGLAALGPEATMTKSTVACPSARMASVITEPTSRSVIPARSQPGTRACTRSIAAPASRSASTSAAVFLIRSGRSAPPASARRAEGSVSRNFSTNSAHIRSERPTAATSPSRPATIPKGSAVSSQAMISRPSGPAGEASAAGSSRRGTNKAGSPCAGTARQVSRSSCLAS
jgi:hypothetical protein